MTKNCPLCNSTATELGHTMYAKGGVRCDNMDCCLHTVGIPAGEWNSRPEVESMEAEHSRQINDGLVELLAREKKAEDAEMLQYAPVESMRGTMTPEEATAQLRQQWPDEDPCISECMDKVELILKDAKDKGLLVTEEDAAVTVEIAGVYEINGIESIEQPIKGNKMTRRTKAERRARARRFFKVLLNIISIGIIPIMSRRGAKARRVAGVISEVSGGVAEVMDD